MKKLLFIFAASSILWLASCDTEHCTCHTFGAVKKAKDHTKAVSSIEKPTATQHQ